MPSYEDTIKQVVKYKEKREHLKSLPGDYSDEIRELNYAIQTSLIIRAIVAAEIPYNKNNTPMIRQYRHVCDKGFVLNGVRYVRLVGTPSGIKSGTILFIDESLSSEIQKRIDNDRRLTDELNPAKFEAYRALCCSTSTAVSMPRFAVVPDYETKFITDVIKLDDSAGGEPVMTECEEEITNKPFDGMGLISPAPGFFPNASASGGYISLVPLRLYTLPSYGALTGLPLSYSCPHIPTV
jgi:hypothetical protein